MNIRKVAGIVFYDEQKRILLQDRRDISKWGEEWGFFGGKIEAGETPEQALVREIQEELTFDLKEYKKVGMNEFDLDGMHVYEHMYAAPLRNHLSSFVQREGQGMKLFSIEQAHALKLIDADYVMLDLIEVFLKKIST